MSIDYTIRSKTPKKKDYEYYNRSKSAKKSDRSNSSKKSPPEYQVKYNLNSLQKSIEYTKSHASPGKAKVFVSRFKVKIRK